MASVVPWLTFRGLHTDRLEGFSAAHRLAFRGLPAEGLGDCSREAASLPTRQVGSSGVLSWMQQEGLSWAGRRVSDPCDGLSGGISADSQRPSGGHKNMAAVALPFGIFGMIRAVLHAIQSAHSPLLGAVRVLRRARGSRSDVPLSFFFRRGIRVVGTWIFDFNRKNR